MMVKAKLSDGQRHVGVRIPESVFQEVEKHLAKMREGLAPGVELKLADALRNLIVLGLEAGSKK